MKEAEGGVGLPFAVYFCMILVGVFGLQVTTPFDPGFQAGESPWHNFFLSFFGHSGGEHLLNNLFFLGLFGSIFELLTSKKTFLYTFLVSAVFANFTAFIFYTDSYIIGASGGAMGVMSALAVYKPTKIGLALGVPVPMYMVLAVYIMINLAGLGVQTGTAYEAHLFGLFTGSIIGLWLRNNDSELSEDGRANKGPGKKKRRPIEDPIRKQKEDAEEEEVVENWEEKIKAWERKYMIN